MQEVPVAYPDNWVGSFKLVGGAIFHQMLCKDGTVVGLACSFYVHLGVNMSQLCVVTQPCKLGRVPVALAQAVSTKCIEGSFLCEQCNIDLVAVVA